MKIGVLTGVIVGICTGNLIAQSLLNKTMFPLPKELQKGAILSVEKNVDNQLAILYSAKVKKNDVYKAIIFDQGLTKVGEKDFTIEKIKTIIPDYKQDGPYKYPRFVRINFNKVQVTELQTEIPGKRLLMVSKNLWRTASTDLLSAV